MCHALCGNEADSSSVSSLLSKPRQLKPAILMVGYKCGVIAAAVDRGIIVAHIVDQRRE